MDVQDEAQCGSHGKSRVSVGPWLLSALAPPTAGVPFSDWYGTNGWIGPCAAVLREAPWPQSPVSG